jgi:type II secretory pathway pseudopilin PulG
MPLSPLRAPCDSAPRGIMLLGLLIVLALSGLALMAAVDMWSMTSQRERERQLLFVGDQYRDAIRRYWFAAPPGKPRLLPGKLELLLEDDRYPTPLRHLRRLYPDPITGTTEWGLLRDGDGISGVYSLSEAQPVKQAGFEPIHEFFNGSTRYRDWVFAFVVPRRNTLLPPPTPGASPRTPPTSTTRPVRGTPP